MSQTVHAVIDRRDVGVQPIGFGRRDEFSPYAVEQGVAQLLFGVGEDLADGGLRDVEHLGRPGHRAAGIYGMKYFDLAQSHLAFLPRPAMLSITSGYAPPKNCGEKEGCANGIMTGMAPTRFIAFLVVWLFASVSSAATLSGQIVDTAGHPIEGAIASVGEITASVSGDGSFSLSVPDQDTYALVAAAPGFFPMRHTFSRADIENHSSDELEIPAITLVERTDTTRLLVFAGDAMLGRRFVEPRAGEPALVRKGTELDDMRAILQHVKPYFELADFASVNLETQLSSQPLLTPLPKSVTFLTHPAIAKALRWAGVDYVALGNNHTFDFQDDGLESTLDAVRSAGLDYSGAGFNEPDARAAADVDLDGQGLRLLSYVGWAGSSEPSQVAAGKKGGAALGTAGSIVDDLAAASENTIDILQYHSGLEYVSQPPLAEETQLKLAIDAGADIAIGHHAHVLQGFEIYRDSLVAYSLGNFVFDQYIPSTHSSMLLFAWFDGDRFVRAEAVPMHVNGYVPTPASGAIRYDILQRLARLTRSNGTCVSATGGHLAIERCTADDPEVQQLQLPESAVAGDVLSLRHLGAKPVPEISAVLGADRYRLGIDLLRRGEFDYAGLFGTVDRTWIEHPNVRLDGSERRSLRIDLPENEAVRTGTKVFTRVFTRSAPATLSVDLAAQGCGEIHFGLQRRRDGVAFEEALATGPVESIGSPGSRGTGRTGDHRLPAAQNRNAGHSPDHRREELRRHRGEPVDTFDRTGRMANAVVGRRRENTAAHPGHTCADTDVGEAIASVYEPAKTCYWSPPGAVASLEPLNIGTKPYLGGHHAYQQNSGQVFTGCTCRSPDSTRFRANRRCGRRRNRGSRCRRIANSRRRRYGHAPGFRTVDVRHRIDRRDVGRRTPSSHTADRRNQFQRVRNHRRQRGSWRRRIHQSPRSRHRQHARSDQRTSHGPASGYANRIVRAGRHGQLEYASRSCSEPR